MITVQVVIRTRVFLHVFLKTGKISG